MDRESDPGPETVGMDQLSRLKRKAVECDLSSFELCSYLRILMSEEYEASSAISKIAGLTRESSFRSALQGIAEEKKEHAKKVWGIIELIESGENERLDRAIAEGWETQRSF